MNFNHAQHFRIHLGLVEAIWCLLLDKVAWDKTGNIIGINNVRAQTVQTLANVEAVLKEGGAKLSDVVKCNVYLKDMKDFQIMNEEFAKLFPDNPPARTTVQTPMAESEMLVEIEAIAYIGE